MNPTRSIVVQRSKSNLTRFLRRTALMLLATLTPWGQAIDISAWSQMQSFALAQTGLVRIALPPATLQSCRAGLEDLRALDPTGQELPFLITRSQIMPRPSQRAKSFEVQLLDQATVVTIETGLDLPIADVSLESPAASFLKSVQIEGSADRQTWQVLMKGLPWFRRSGAAQLSLPVTPKRWRFLKITVNDRRSDPVPITGAIVHAAESEATPNEIVPLEIIERIENPGQTRLSLRLDSANLTLAWLQIDCTDPLFTRQTTAAVPEITDNNIRERPIAEGALYRISPDNQATVTNLVLPIEQQIPTRELILLVQNDDNPPLNIRTVTAVRRPVYLTFLATTPGTYRLYSGDSLATAPRYDFAAIAQHLRNAPTVAVQPSAIGTNPAYHTPETLPQVSDLGAALEISPWAFRKIVTLSAPGVQQLELDLEVLAHAQTDFRDLRLMRDQYQVPYLFDHPSITRRFQLGSSVMPDPKFPRQSRWQLKLPRAHLPIFQLRCESKTPLFKRSLMLYELVRDDRGEEFQRELGRTDWVQTPDRTSRQFFFRLNVTPITDTVFLVTDNGDNPAIELAGFEAFYPVTRLVFKSSTPTPIKLYYGFSDIASPAYDLSLVARQLLQADKINAQLQNEEALKPSSWAKGFEQKAGLLFWSVLGLVVVGLLFLVARLLPKPAPPA
jgi:hypothetical protein